MDETDRLPVRRRAGVLVRRTLDGAVLLAPDAGAQPVRLNVGAAIVWDLLAQPATARDLASTVADLFELDPERADADVHLGIDALRDARLIGDDE